MTLNLLDSMVDAESPVNETLMQAILDDSKNISEDGAEFNQTGLGATALSSATKNGLLSKTMHARLATTRIKRGSYSGNGTTLEVTVESGETITAILIFGNSALWISLASAMTLGIAAGGNSLIASGGLAINSSSAGKITAVVSGGGPNVSGQTYTYVALFA